MVAVAEYPPEVVEAATEEERLDAARELALVGMGGKLLHEKPVEQRGHKGREQVIEVEGLGVMRTRLFWVGRRLYLVKVVFKREFLNAAAATYFLDSFRLEGPPREKIVPRKPNLGDRRASRGIRALPRPLLPPFSQSFPRPASVVQ
jgi:hypothetical protein